jgi:hypothetical protein
VSHLSWLNTRRPSSPPALKRRIEELFEGHPEWAAMPAADALLAAGEALLAEVLTAAPRDRRAALSLLAADACVTYAFEAAADAPSQFVARAEQAMKRIAELSEGR